MRYEYKVVPAPARGEKSKGVKAPEGRFAYALEHLLNDMGAEGWEFQRAETLPSEERAGLTSSVTVWRNVLVFRRAIGAAAAAAETPKLLASPERLSPTAGLGAAGLVAGARPAAARPAPTAQGTADTPTEDAAEPQAATALEADWRRPEPTDVNDIGSNSDTPAAQDAPAGTDGTGQRPLSFLESRAARLRGEGG